MKTTFNKKKAFTLIELLIVIAIIGILFIVLVSKVDFATDKAKATGVQTDFRTFQLAFQTVAREHQGFSSLVDEDYEQLEMAINKNIDNKLKIDIDTDGNITMANGATDPWNTPYHGNYITNATDKKDRGAIVMYSNGANGEFGSEHSIANGVVTVNVLGNNKYGKDDYSIAVVYTFTNGYGEVQTSTSGFSNNQTTQGNISNNSGTEGTEEPSVTELLEPGLYNAGAIALAENGDVEAAQDMMKTSWNDLLAAGIVHVTNGAVHSNFDFNTGGNASSTSLYGDLVLPNDGSITSIGDAVVDLASGNIIGNIAFAFCYNLTGITIPKGVTNTSDMAFAACGLTSVTIPDRVTYIGMGAFTFCTSLTSVTIPDRVTYIGEMAFDDCDNLQYNEYDNAYYLGSNNNPYLLLVKAKDENITSINIHNNTRFIYSYAFYRCSNLTSVTIPDSVIEIGVNAFDSCSGITSIEIPNSVTSIGNHAFAWCTSLEGVVIPDSVTTIDEWTFAWCTSLTSIEIPNSVTSIGYRAFYQCKSLTSVTMGNSVTTIGDYAFDSSGITNIEIPNSVTSIDIAAFYQCKSLTSVTMGNSVTTIGNGAFADCTGLISIEIPNSVTSIGHSAFLNCTSLTSITIPNGVTYIGNEVFNNCSSLQYNEYDNAYYLGSNNNPYCMLIKVKDTNITSINIHSNTKIIYYAFSGCFSLTSVTIPNGVTSIGACAFWNCFDLTSIEIPDSVTSIDYGAFGYCRSLTSVTIGNSVTSIGEHAFYDCGSLTSIEIPDSVINIGKNAFSGCGLTIITVDESNEYYRSIDGNLYSKDETIFIQYAIKNTNTSFTIPDSVTIIVDYALNGCSSLESIIIPDSVTSIGEYAIYNCSSLTSVVIGNSVTSIDKYAFGFCSSLTNIIFNGTKAEWSSISKQSDWNYNVPATYVQCTDGQVTL